MIEAGASRLGTSDVIIKGEKYEVFYILKMKDLKISNSSAHVDS
jgi:hypothetical protein